MSVTTYSSQIAAANPAPVESLRRLEIFQNEEGGLRPGMTFAEHVIARYSGYQAQDAQLAAGKYLVALRHDYLRGIETVATLESKLLGLYERLEFPGWLSKLLTHPVTGLENYQDMMQTLTTERGAIKVFVHVAYD